MTNSAQRKVLLIGWDAADWKVIHPLMDEGKLPTLERLIEGGVMANLATLQPVLSPMLWTSIATGKRPFKHGVHGFSEPTPDGQAVQPVTNLSRKTKAIWNILTQNGLRSNVVGWWPSHPAEPINGAMVSNHFQRATGPPEQPWPTPPGAVHPPELTRTLAQLRLNPNELAAEHILPFVPRAAEIDQKEDRRLASCAKILAECTSVHAVATWLMQHQPWDFMAVYYDAIDHFGHGFMRYHPPRQQHISEEDFALYRGVVEAGYRYHDMMLHALLQLAGPETTVLLISDHGFHPDQLRPTSLPDEPAGPAVEHRDFGIFVASGPGIRRDALLHGLNLLDVAPTVLTLFGLPVGDDMDGAPIVAAFESPPQVETIESWDAVAGDAGRHPPERQLDATESAEALEQLVALGYIEPLGPDRQEAVRRTVRELQCNLARAYVDDQQHGPAAEILSELYDEWPGEHRFGTLLALCYQALERISDFRAVVEALSSRRQADAEVARGELREFIQERREAPDTERPLKLSPLERMQLRQLRSRAMFSPHAMEYLWGCVNFAEGDYNEALRRFLRAAKIDARRPALHLQLGEAYLKLRRLRDARNSFQKAADIDPENPHAWLGLAMCALRARRFPRAATRALKAIGLLYHQPRAHYVLGMALARLDRTAEAMQALDMAIELNPNFSEAHALAAKLYETRLNDPDRAAEHQALAAEMRKARRNSRRRKPRYSPQPWPPPNQPKFQLLRNTAKRAERFPAAPRPNPADRPSEPVTIVTGLPRSGTSMLMQMLAAGGMPVYTDNVRKPDDDNPRGYFEHEAAKRLARDSSWLVEAVGKGVKIVAQLMPYLPRGIDYRVLWIQRSLDEVLDSQQALLDRNEVAGGKLSRDKFKSVYAKQLVQVRRTLDARPDVRLLALQHHEVIENPAAAAAAMNNFLDGDLDQPAMAASVDRSLYRQRVGGDS